MTTQNKTIFGAKVVVMGAAAVGKTSLVDRIIKDEWTQEDIPTVGAAYFKKKLFVPSGAQVHIDLWDTAGQERYATFMPMYYRDASAALVCYDLSEKSSLTRAIAWVDELVQLGEIIVFLVGTKSDLCRSEFLDDASQYAQSRQIPFVITSAKTGSGVTDLMDLLAQKIEHAGRTSKGKSITVRVGGQLVRSTEPLKFPGGNEAQKAPESSCSC